MTRPVQATLDAQALRHNLLTAKKHASKSRVMAIIKANGYGHGIQWTAKTLNDGVAFGVASVEEAIAVREAGITAPICLLEGFFEASEIPLLEQYGLAPVIHDEYQIGLLERYVAATPLNVWIKVDTGMHRIGFTPDRFMKAMLRLEDCKCIGRIRLMAHFPNADNTFDSTTMEQCRVAQELNASFGLEQSMANSAAIFNWPETHLDWVRPGIMLYGASPNAGSAGKQLDLKPVMTFRSKLIAVHQRKQGDPIGYGGDYVCSRDMPVGVVAVGYGDGYPRNAPKGTPVLVKGKPVSLIGRVSMDMITVSLRKVPDAKPGDPVVLWGKRLPVEEIANRTNTIAYELLCRVTDRVPRIEQE